MAGHNSIRLVLAGLLIGLLILFPVGETGGTNPERLTVAPAPVPQPCAGIVTVRFADLWQSFNSVELMRLPMLAQFKERYGVDLTPMERVSLVFPTPEEQPLEILRCELELPRKTVLQACLREWTDEKIQGHVIHVSKDGRAVWFINDRGLVMGERDRVAERVGSAHPESVGGLQEVMAQAEREHVTVYFQGPMVQLSEVLKKQDLRSAQFTLSCGKAIDIRLRAEMGHASGAGTIAKYLRGFVNLARGQMLMMGGIQDAEGVIPDVGIEHLDAIPFDLIRLAEKGLAQTSIDTKGTTVTLATSLPIESRYLEREFRTLSAKMKKRGLDIVEMLPFGVVLSRYESAPVAQYSPPVSGAISPSLGTPSPTGRLPVFTPGPGGPSGYPVPVDSVVGLPAAPGQPSWAPPPTPTSVPAQTLPTGPCPIPPPLPATVQQTGLPTVKWTVANLRREEMVLFEMARDGKMTFRHKVSPGDAVDLTSPVQQRWVAFSPLGTTAESFEVKPEGVWLLRGPHPAPTSAIPVTVQVAPPPATPSVVPVHMVPHLVPGMQPPR